MTWAPSNSERTSTDMSENNSTFIALIIKFLLRKSRNGWYGELISLFEKLWLLLGAVPLLGKYRGVGKFEGLLEDKDLFALGKKDVKPTDKSRAV